MLRLIPAAIVLAVFATTTPADDIQTLQSVGDHSENAAAARAARDALVAGGSSNLLPVLEAFKGSALLATNWLRSAFEAIADGEIKAGRPLPKNEMLGFVRTTSESPAARRLAYEWLLKSDPQLEDDLIPGMLLDPSPEFRRDAVARLIDEGKNTTGDAAIAIYQQALAARFTKIKSRRSPPPCEQRRWMLICRNTLDF